MPQANTLTPPYPTDDVSAWSVPHMRLMGAPMGVVTEKEAVRAIVDAAAADRGHWTITANLDHLRRYHRDPAQKGLIDEADLVVADGMPLIWASRLAGAPLPERVSGSSMVWSICEAAERTRAIGIPTRRRSRRGRTGGRGLSRPLSGSRDRRHGVPSGRLRERRARARPHPASGHRRRRHRSCSWRWGSPSKIC